MRGQLLLFEDESASLFEPAALLRCVAELRMGAWTHRERWERLLPEREIGLLCRGDLAAIERESGRWTRVVAGGETDSGTRTEAGDTLFVAAALGRPSPALLAQVRELGLGDALVSNGRLVAARAAGERAARLVDQLAHHAGRPILAEAPTDSDPSWPGPLEELGFAVRDARSDGEPVVPATLADLVSGAAAALAEDFETYVHVMPEPARAPGSHLVHPGRIRLGDGVRIDPGAVLDASEGPILIAPDVRVMANAVITGPVAIGLATLVKPGARIGPGTCLGPVCKVGGEIEGSIMQGFSNKQHDGFLGHSYLGSWVNLGAATDTSDLKNNYGEVRITLAGREHPTGSRHVGSFIGDHSKTGIHTMLNTGTVVGAFANLFGAGFPPKEIPSFAWGGDGAWQEHRLEKARQVAAIVLSRRGEKASAAFDELAGRLFEATSIRRRAWLSQFASPDARMSVD